MHAMKISTKISVCALFCVLGFLGNWFKLPLFFNVDFLFGSLFTMLTIMAVAGACGIITGTVVSEAARKILADWIQEHHRNVQILSILVGDANAGTFEHTQHCVEIVKAATPAFRGMGVFNQASIAVGYSPLEQDGKPTVGTDMLARGERNGSGPGGCPWDCEAAWRRDSGEKRCRKMERFRSFNSSCRI